MALPATMGDGLWGDMHRSVESVKVGVTPSDGSNGEGCLDEDDVHGVWRRLGAHRLRLYNDRPQPRIGHCTGTEDAREHTRRQTCTHSTGPNPPAGLRLCLWSSQESASHNRIRGQSCTSSTTTRSRSASHTETHPGPTKSKQDNKTLELLQLPANRAACRSPQPTQVEISCGGVDGGLRL